MLNFKNIAAAYPDYLQGFQRNILREYLQYKMLESIFSWEDTPRLCFIGGTALRIVHNTARFSEDLDFDHQGLSEENFIAVADKVKKDLEQEGYLVEIRNVFKGAYHCYVRFPKLLFDTGLSPFAEEKILLQIDCEAQGVNYQPTPVVINKFDVFTRIMVAPVDILLSQKIYAALNGVRAKGRDFFDIVELFSRTEPNFEYLSNKLHINTPAELKEELTALSKKLDFEQLAKDVSPFLFFEKDRRKVLHFPEFVKSLA